MKFKFTVEFGGSVFNLEWNSLDHSVWLFLENGSKINYGNGKATSLVRAKKVAIEMLQSMSY